MSDRPTITAALITLDEAANLAELLPALDWVDEIVVVDGGSCDDTVEIARSHGCRVVSRRFDNFAEQRNHAVRLATSDWVLSLDADERPTPRLVAEIGRRLARPRFDAFRIPIRSVIFGRPVRRCGTQDDRPVRLFRRAKARWDGDVHEVLRVRGRIGSLQAWMTHRTMPDLATFLAKVHRYTSLEARARVARGRRPGWYDAWIAPPREIFRRLIWKQGLLDGPAGWTFSVLSGLSEWILARQHRRLWQERERRSHLAGGLARRCAPIGNIPQRNPKSQRELTPATPTA